MTAVKQHSDMLDTVVTLRENGRLVCVVERDSPNFGPTVRFVDEGLEDTSGAVHGP